MSEKIQTEEKVEEQKEETPKQEEKQEETVESKLARTEELVAELQDRLMRLMAEFDNYRKRVMKEKAELIRNAGADVVTDILPIIDDLERAIRNSEKSDDYDALKEGIGLIYNKLMHTLEQKGLEKISPKNEPFNTDLHEAIATLPATEETPAGTVIDCAIDGYKMNDKVLRYAKVAVAQ